MAGYAPSRAVQPAGHWRGKPIQISKARLVDALFVRGIYGSLETVRQQSLRYGLSERRLSDPRTRRTVSGCLFVACVPRCVCPSSCFAVSACGGVCANVGRPPPLDASMGVGAGVWSSSAGENRLRAAVHRPERGALCPPAPRSGRCTAVLGRLSPAGLFHAPALARGSAPGRGAAPRSGVVELFIGAFGGGGWPMLVRILLQAGAVGHGDGRAQCGTHAINRYP